MQSLWCEHKFFQEKKKPGGLCITVKRCHPRHRHSLIRMHLFYGFVGDEPSSRFTPNESTPIIAFQAKPRFIRKDNIPPKITHPVDILTCPLQMFSSMA
ncbi:hypothetical protein TNCV_1073921 [Trichonephila clavipes]|uniref:Uncharacterized protein n=1 Tax=Trichonephila clavipes TaxID=2585209 RepID=A0A8X6SPP0_TRICX|nr:hypothetical protein TNCV_1073921 [Trichonephila clavipes]